MTLKERIEEREFQKEVKKYKITFFVLLSIASFFFGLYRIECDKVESIKMKVISYDFDRGKRELINIVKEY